MTKWSSVDDDRVSRTLGWLCAVFGAAVAVRIIHDLWWVLYHPAFLAGEIRP